MKRIVVAAVCLVLTCCNAEKPIETKIHDAANGVDLIIEHRSGPALSQSEDKLYIVSNGERKLIFEGYGGSALSLPSLKRGVLIVAYCGGAIRSADSFLAKENAAREVTAVKVQPIITSGIQMNGKLICDGQPLSAAGAEAAALVEQWEARGRLTPSLPQMLIGASAQRWLAVLDKRTPKVATMPVGTPAATLLARR